MGNKTGIRKERRGLTKESGTYTYGYDALDRLESIRKDNVLETQYRYDAFGNRIKKESEEHQTSYWYNSLNQLINLTDQSQEGTSRETYLYDRRGNLSQVIRDGTVKNQYVYGAINRLEQAVNGSGAKANYLYNGLGHRVGKEITLDPTKQLRGQSQKPDSRIDYLIDLTREYHNLLEKTEDGISQTYFWDGNVAAFEESGKRSYYLQDELGSPLRIEDESGFTRETYGYGAFGENLYGNQGVLQVFGYTGYQRDNVAGTYYAQAREYQAEVGRFAGRDIVKGYFIVPMSLNEYSYCINNSLLCQDNNGMWITIAVGAAIGCIGGIVSQVVTDIVTGEKPSLKKYVTSAVSGAIGGAVGGATGNMATAGAASAASSTLIEGIWDIADGTTEFTADNVTKLALDTVGSAVFGAGIGYVTGKMGEKIVKSSSTLKNWEFKYKYADRRIKQGTFTLLKTLEINGKKFFALEAISAFPDFVTNTLIPITKSRLKDKEKLLEKTEISYVTEYLQKLSELLREEKFNEMIECPIM